MPPRHAYWTIILEGKPTAFRTHTQEELLPTFRQLQGKHPDVVMKWFSRGRLWESPEEEDAEAARKAAADHERRGPGWRPGGRHEDPRARFKIPRDEKRRRFAERLRRDGERSGAAVEAAAKRSEPSEGPEGTAAKPQPRAPGDERMPPREDREPRRDDERMPPREDRRPRGPWRPKGPRPPRDNRPRGPWAPPKGPGGGFRGPGRPPGQGRPPGGSRVPGGGRGPGGPGRGPGGPGRGPGGPGRGPGGPGRGPGGSGRWPGGAGRGPGGGGRGPGGGGRGPGDRGPGDRGPGSRGPGSRGPGGRRGGGGHGR